MVEPVAVAARRQRVCRASEVQRSGRYCERKLAPEKYADLPTQVFGTHSLAPLSVRITRRAIGRTATGPCNEGSLVSARQCMYASDKSADLSSQHLDSPSPAIPQCRTQPSIEQLEWQWPKAIGWDPSSWTFLLAPDLLSSTVMRRLTEPSDLVPTMKAIFDTDPAILFAKRRAN